MSARKIGRAALFKHFFKLRIIRRTYIGRKHFRICKRSSYLNVRLSFCQSDQLSYHIFKKPRMHSCRADASDFLFVH